MTSSPVPVWPGAPARVPAAQDSEIRGWELIRCKLAARLDRLLRWEYWPAWAIYLPLIPYICYLAIRYRGITTCALANPSIPLSGLVGESKWDILRLLPEDAVVPATLLRPAALHERTAALDSTMRDGAWCWPVILKPDVGERGKGVRLVRNADEARRYLEQHPDATIAQAFDPGPCEAGVFYVRSPAEPSGRIFSITDKRFPTVTGDGVSSIRTLVWRHPRHRAQAGVFLGDPGVDMGRVPPRGERVALGFMGNHCRGSMFLDGAALITPELTAAIDAIAKRTPGFHFGRFDIRYSSVRSFKAGRDFRIVELNGLSSESTNIYDPRTGFLRAQAVLREQWRWAYLIGHTLLKRGLRKPAWSELPLPRRRRSPGATAPPKAERRAPGAPAAPTPTGSSHGPNQP